MCSVTVQSGEGSRPGFDSQFFISSSRAGSQNLPVACCPAGESSLCLASGAVGYRVFQQ